MKLMNYSILKGDDLYMMASIQKKFARHGRSRLTNSQRYRYVKYT